MAQSGPSITARIRLEGAQQVNQQLQALGQVGQQAANSIGNARPGDEQHWATLGQGVERARAA